MSIRLLAFVRVWNHFVEVSHMKSTNTLTEGLVLVIDIVTLKKKKEISEQNYGEYAQYYTNIERMNQK